MKDLDDEWEIFLDDETVVTNENNIENNYNSDIAPVCEDLYISTKSKFCLISFDLLIN